MVNGLLVCRGVIGSTLFSPVFSEMELFCGLLTEAAMSLLLSSLLGFPAPEGDGFETEALSNSLVACEVDKETGVIASAIAEVDFSSPKFNCFKAICRTAKKTA